MPIEVWRLFDNLSSFGSVLHRLSQATLHQSTMLSALCLYGCPTVSFPSVSFSDSMSSLEALSRFKLELHLAQKIIKDYTNLTNNGKQSSFVDSKSCKHPRQRESRHIMWQNNVCADAGGEDHWSSTLMIDSRQWCTKTCFVCHEIRCGPLWNAVQHRRTLRSVQHAADNLHKVYAHN